MGNIGRPGTKTMIIEQLEEIWVEFKYALHECLIASIHGHVHMVHSFTC